MRTVPRILALIAGGLLTLIALAIAAVYAISAYQTSKTYALPDARLAVPVSTDAAAIERGRYLVRAIRYGAKPSSAAILVMPSEDHNRLNDADLGAVISYLRTVPRVDRAKGTPEVPLLGRVLLVAGLIPTPGIHRIDLEAARLEPVPAGPTAEHGAYLANISCVGCHGKSFSGGAMPGAGPSDPKARNLAPGGNLGRWSEEQFIATLRTGKTPEGAGLNPLSMPWPVFSRMTDDDLKAPYAYFRTLPARADEQP
jgi:mono/diheme cytochrome c family protein